MKHLATIVFLFVATSAVLIAQPRVVWDEFRLVSGISQFDVSMNERFIVFLEPAARVGMMLGVFDQSSGRMNKYTTPTEEYYLHFELGEDGIVQLFGAYDRAEFDLESRRWILQIENSNTDKICDDGGSISEFNEETRVCMIAEYRCEPPNVRVYDADTYEILVQRDVPAPFEHASLGRTRTEVVYYGAEGVGLSPSKLITIPDDAYVDWVKTLGSEVYALLRNGSDTSTLCRLDLDEAKIVAQIPNTLGNGGGRIGKAPDPRHIHLFTNEKSPMLDRFTLDSIYTSPYRTYQPVVKRGDSYYQSDIGGHLYKLDNPNMPGDTVIYKQKKTRAATVDHLGRIIISDDTVKAVDPMTGHQTNLHVSNSMWPASGTLIADRDVQTLIILGKGREYVGPLFQEVVQNFKTRPDNDTPSPDTTYRLEQAVRVDRDKQLYTTWCSYTLSQGHGWRAGYTPWTCVRSGPTSCWGGGDQSNGPLYSILNNAEIDTTVEAFLAPVGKVGYLVGDTTFYLGPMIGVGDNYIVNGRRTEFLELRSGDGHFVKEFKSETGLSPLAASGTTQQVLCWRSSEKSLCLFSIPQGRVIWSRHVWDKPIAVAMDPDGKWFFASYNYGRQQVFELLTTGVQTTIEPEPSCLMSGTLARVYNVLGEQIATLPIEPTGSIAHSTLEALPQQPLWAVAGECVKRVR